MDQETRRWIVDRVIWVIGLAFGMLFAASAFAEGAGALATSSDTSVAVHGPDAPSETLIEAV